MLFDLEGKVHVTRRADTMKFFTRAWVFPGGHVDPGEVLEEAALRELHEAFYNNKKLGEFYANAAYESNSEGKDELPGSSHIIIFFVAKLDVVAE